MSSLIAAVASQPVLATAWDFGDFLTALQQTILSYGKVIIGIIGLIMVVASVYQIAKNLISHGKSQTNWVITIALLLVGGVLMLSSSWDFIKSVSEGGKNTLDDLGQGNADNASFVSPSAMVGGYMVSFE